MWKNCLKMARNKHTHMREHVQSNGKVKSKKQCYSSVDDKLKVRRPRLDS